DGRLAKDPYPTYGAMRSACPVQWSDRHGGHWVLVGYDGVSRAARDDANFLSAPGVNIPKAPINVIPLETDGPITQKYRAILHHRFTPAATQALAPAIRARADALVDGITEAGAGDLMTDVATPLTAQTILDIIGIPVDRAADIVSWVHAIVHDMAHDPAAGLQAGVAIYQEIANAIAAHREGAPRDDALSDLLAARIDGEPLPDDILFKYVLLLIMGGMDTSAAALGNAVVRIDRDPDLRHRLLSEPDLMEFAVEEFLRIDSPVQGLGRTLAADVELEGQTLRAGECAMLVWAAANRDPAVYPNPDEIDLDRKVNRHLAFGVGPHRCLGSNLGRQMFRTLLETVLDRLPDFTIEGDPDEYRFADVGAVYAHRHLPVRFTPGTRC
ncbi:MAG TPA: cytochrome P450, partial [Acidimicrobiia bacterium]|nr:cytochrome P450 [Acidimicrobiia bacterium]